MPIYLLGDVNQDLSCKASLDKSSLLATAARFDKNYTAMWLHVLKRCRCTDRRTGGRGWQSIRGVQVVAT